MDTGCVLAVAEHHLALSLILGNGKMSVAVTLQYPADIPKIITDNRHQGRRRFRDTKASKHMGNLACLGEEAVVTLVDFTALFINYVCTGSK